MIHQPNIIGTISPDAIKAIAIVIAIWFVMAFAERGHD